MKVEVIEKSPVEKSVSIEVGPEKYKKSLDKIINDVRRSVTIPGFRKGKAPKKIVIRKIGMDSLKKDLLEELIPEISLEVLEERNLVPLSTPVCTNYEEIVIEEGKPINFVLEFEVKPEFEISDYKGLDLEKIVYDVNQDELLEKQIKSIQEQSATMVPIEEDRGVKEGDVAHVDFESFHKDGTPVKGGSASDYYMTVEKQNFIPGFVEHIMNRKAGESWEFEAEFPDTYPEPSLAGSTVDFKMTLHSIMKKELPQLDDDFAKSQGKYETYKEMEDAMKVKIADHVEQQYRYQLQDKIMKQLVEKMSDMPVPQSLVRGHQERFLKNMAEMLERQGKSLQEHLNSLKVDIHTFLKQIEPQSEAAAKGELILDKIAQQENVEVSDEEINEQVQKVADNLGQSLDMVRKAMERDKYLSVISYEVRNRKIFDLIIENANLTEKSWEQVQKEMEEKVKAESKPSADASEEVGEPSTDQQDGDQKE